MKFLYDLSIFLYASSIHLASLFSSKAKLWVRGRKGQFGRMKTTCADGGNTVWFHVASLGEFEQGRPLIERLRSDHPTWKILLTFFSPSGYEIRKNYDGADHVFYLPIDTKRNARRFLDIVRPSLAVFVKYEFWLNYIDCLSARGIPVVSVSAVFRENQYYFRRYGAFALKRLHKITRFFVQNEHSLKLLAKHGITHATLSGDTRFDRVADLKSNPVAFPVMEQTGAGRNLLVAGSVWEPDEEILIPLLERYPRMVLVIAPHEVNEKRIAQLREKLRSFGCVAFSRLHERIDPSVRVIVIDSIGILAHLYRYAGIVYIGGGFGRGIHNILEAAVFGKPVIFGPNYLKFSEAVELIQLGGAFPVKDGEELNNTVASLLNDDNLYSRASETCSSYCRKKKGVVDRIAAEIYGLHPGLK